MASFVLDTRLQEDSVEVGNLDLCTVRLMDDARYPWLILVPRVADIVEIHELGDGAQAQLWREVTDTGRVLTGIYHADKPNVAALGNVVPQPHVYVIARVAGDATPLQLRDPVCLSYTSPIPRDRHKSRVPSSA